MFWMKYHEIRRKEAKRNLGNVLSLRHAERALCWLTPAVSGGDKAPALFPSAPLRGSARDTPSIVFRWDASPYDDDEVDVRRSC
jgi:hypothetical protein